MGFQQGLSGLATSSKALDTVGNNIANSGTVGYKAGTTQFADVFAASLNGTGTLPIGLGSKVAAVVQQFTQGNISLTNNSLDTAINGGGFFQMDDGSGGTVYTRNGQFQLDKDGYLVNPSTGGLKLMGIPAKDGIIMNGTKAEPIRMFDPTQSLSGQPLATGKSSAASGVQANLNLDSRLAVPATTPFDHNDPTSYNKSTSVPIYDSLGNEHTYTLYFAKTTNPNEWQVYTTVTNPAGATPTFTDLSAGGAIPAATLNFSTTGLIIAPSSAVQNISAADLGYAGAVDDLDFPLDFSGATQNGSTFVVNAMVQDGYAAGSLSGFVIGADGTVLGRYSNGRTEVVGQITLATFRNPQGLIALGNNLWDDSTTSGTPLVGSPGSSGQFGSLQSSSLEDANIDLTAELVNMIVLQRSYQANAQTIKTQDSILQTLVNLR